VGRPAWRRGPRAGASAEQARDLSPREPRRARRRVLGSGRRTHRQEGSVGHAEAWEVEHGAELKRAAGTARVVASGGVRNHDLGPRQ
jgi:hypothetical protein